MTYNIFTIKLFWWTLLSLYEFNAFSMYNHSVGVLVSGTPFWVLCQWEVHPFVGLKKPSSSVGPLETIFVSWWKEIDKASEGRLDWIDKKGVSMGEHDFFSKLLPTILALLFDLSCHRITLDASNTFAIWWPNQSFKKIFLNTVFLK